jgi:hypothetical protein
MAANLGVLTEADSGMGFRGLDFLVGACAPVHWEDCAVTQPPAGRAHVDDKRADDRTMDEPPSRG